MKHVIALIIKFIMVAVILEIILLSGSNFNFYDILWISLVVTILSYFIGDILILPLTNNTVATICDGILSFVVIYLFNYIYSYKFIPASSTLIAAVVLSIGEWFFHKYMADRVFPERREG